MLNQYLISNQTLELNKSFQIYVKVLSLAHMQVRKPKRAPKKFGQLHVGHNDKKETCHYWALNPPVSYPKEPTKNVFADKCLLISVIFGLLQNAYYASCKQDRRFLRIQNVNSKVTELKNSACKLLLNELQCLFQTTKLQEIGPYHLQSTIKILHSSYRCQIFVFDNIANSSKLCYMYPVEFNDELQPIYLYQSSPNHILFIRHLKAYFRKNYTICFGCKSKFKSPYNKHLCPKRETCFACRRLYCTEKTFLTEKLLNNYCDKLITKESPKLCTICNCTLHSLHCARGHKLLCNGVGRFGYKCLKECQRFFYCTQNTSQDIKNSHSCSFGGYCKTCHKPKELNHLCRLSHVKILPYHTSLCFFKILFINNEIPITAIFLKETKERGVFTKYTFVNDYLFNINSSQVEMNYFKYRYFPNNIKNSSFADLLRQKTRKISEDFIRSARRLQKKTTLEDRIVAFILQQRNTSFICNDSSSNHLVSLILFTIIMN